MEKNFVRLNCTKSHYEAIHTFLIAIQEEIDRIDKEAKAIKAEKAKKKARELAIAEYRNRLDDLRDDLDDAKLEIEYCRKVWQKAGSPEIHPDDLDAANETVSKLRKKLAAARRKHRVSSVKSMYLSLARRSRGTMNQSAFPSYALMLIVGIACFLIACILGLLVSSNVAFVFGLGIVSLLIGCIITTCILYLPSDRTLSSQLNDLAQHNVELQDQTDDAKLAYEKALRNYNKLAYLDELHAAYEESIRRNRQLEHEYHAERHIK